MPTPDSNAGITYATVGGRRAETSETWGPAYFADRPQTLGAGAFSVGVVFQYTQLDALDGEKVGVDRVPVDTPREPVLFFATPMLIYHLATIGAT